MALNETISGIQEKLQKGLFPNEAAVSQGAVLPILNALGWPAFDSTVVCPQYAVEGGRVDYALCRHGGKPVVFVEVKRVGLANTGERQLLDYAFREGIHIAVLTDGQEWNFYHPLGDARYQERHVYKLDLLERELSECIYRLTRYLSREDVYSGVASENTGADFAETHRHREVARKLPEAWIELVENADESLVELLADKVADLCGYVPDPEICADFLRSRVGTLVPSESSKVGAVESSSVPETNESELLSQPSHFPTDNETQVGYKLYGTLSGCKSAIDVMTEVFEQLSSQDSTFLERFASRKHGSKRRYIAQSQYELYPGRPDFCERNYRELTSRWFLGTYYGKDGIIKILKLACEVAEIEFGKDLVVYLD